MTKLSRFLSCALLSLVLLSSRAALAQAPVPSNPEIDRRVEALIGKMTLEEKIDYIGGTGFAVRAMPGLKLPALEMSDGPLGVRSNVKFPSTTYAAGIGLAASWDPRMAERVGAGIGKDALARGIHFMLTLLLHASDVTHGDRARRNFEYLGEDPFLAVPNSRYG
jgi:beta-glucosidase